MPADQPSIVYGPSAPKPVPLTFGNLLSQHVKQQPNRVAIISHHQKVTLTYKDLDDRSTALAKAFAHYGVRRGDSVAIMLGSRTEYIEVNIGHLIRYKVLTISDFLCMCETWSSSCSFELCFCLRGTCWHAGTYQYATTSFPCQYIPKANLHDRTKAVNYDTMVRKIRLFNHSQSPT